MHAVMPPLKADFKLAVEAHGTHAAQPVAGTLIAGSLLSLRDTHPSRSRSTCTFPMAAPSFR